MNLECRKMWNWKSGWILALTGAGLSFLFRIVFTVLGADGYQAAEQQLLADKSIAVLFLELVFLSPVLEEFLFRRILYLQLRKKMPVMVSMVISSMLFGVYHWNLPQGIYAFIMGMLLAWSLESYRTMKAPMVIHMAANAAAVLLSV